MVLLATDWASFAVFIASAALKLASSALHIKSMLDFFNSAVSIAKLITFAYKGTNASCKSLRNIFIIIGGRRDRCWGGRIIVGNDNISGFFTKFITDHFCHIFIL